MMLVDGNRKWLAVLTLTRLAVGRESVANGTETPVAPRCIHTLMLTGIPHLTLINVCWCHTHTHRDRIIRRKSENTNENLTVTCLKQAHKQLWGKETVSLLTFILSLISALPVLHSYLRRSHPWTQTPADKRGSPAVRNVQDSLCDSGSCGAPLWWPYRSGSSERPSCGTVAGGSCAQGRPEPFGSHMSNFHSWADAPDRRRICHRPAGDAPVGRCTWSCQVCWCTGGHRAVAAAHTH